MEAIRKVVFYPEALQLTDALSDLLEKGAEEVTSLWVFLMVCLDLLYKSPVSPVQLPLHPQVWLFGHTA